jgi:hypothetical protein
MNCCVYLSSKKILFLNNLNKNYEEKKQIIHCGTFNDF